MSNDLNDAIRRCARQVGFDLCGVTAPVIVDRYRNGYLDWLDHDYYGEMTYLKRNIEARLHPHNVLDGTKSVICTAVSYYQRTAVCDDQRGRVAMYAWGRDYHNVVKDMLIELAARINSLIGRTVKFRACVDSSTVMEKPLTAQAGLGWIGTNGCLINRELGSYLFLGELFVDIELPPDEPAVNQCEHCRRCLDACPTGAIVSPGVIDARRCISYLTIEHSGRIDPQLAEKAAGWIFGCDRCQQVCPFNKTAKPTTIDHFKTHRLGPRVDPREVLTWDHRTCTTRTAGTAGSRARLDQWHRNARLALSAPIDAER